MTARKWLLAIALAWLAMFSHGAHAQTCSATSSGISLGTFNPVAPNVMGVTGSITVSCTWTSITLTPNVLVCLNLGGTPRALVNGTNQLLYDLYTDMGHTIQWGSTTAGTTPLSVTLTKPSGTTASATLNFYGQIAANQSTVPTINNATTTYTQTFTGANAGLDYSFYVLIGPTSCTGLVANGSFSLTATATVINDCTITATSISFAPSGLLSSALTANGAITTSCTNGDAFEIALNGGSSNNVAARQMQRSGGGGAVNYQLYLDTGHTTAWGDGTGGTTMATGTGTGNPQVVTVYGQVPAQSTPAPGNYSDTITATISF